MCSIMGLFKMGTMGFGKLQVNGLRRVPSPPAMITAFIQFSPFFWEVTGKMVAFINRWGFFPIRFRRKSAASNLLILFHSLEGYVCPVKPIKQLTIGKVFHHLGVL